MGVAPPHSMMNIKSKLVAAGAVGALGAAAYGVARAIRRRKAASAELDERFDLADLEDPVIVTEEVVVITDPGSYDVDLELFPADRGVGR